MGNGPKRWTEDVIKRRFREGHGQGEREDYIPWVLVQEFSSRGTQTRQPSLCFPRTIHTFSYLERNMYLLHEYELGLRDYKEQFPMSREVTMGAALAMGITHPRYPVTRVPVVMTLDAVVSREAANGAYEVSAWDAKPLALLDDRRVLEKLSLHRAYCNHWGIKHHIFTEQSVHPNVIRNLDWLRSAVTREGEDPREKKKLERLKGLVLSDLYFSKPKKSLANYCAAYDLKNALEPGSTLRACKQLIWERQLEADLTVKDMTKSKVPHALSPLLKAYPGRAS